jgi:geranylgeranyl transferase type-1 subunit beta
MRQFEYLEKNDDDDDDDDDVNPDEDNFIEPTLGSLSFEDVSKQCVGFNGRCNKLADTCYCWWVSGSLSVSIFSALLSYPVLGFAV